MSKTELVTPTRLQEIAERLPNLPPFHQSSVDIGDLLGHIQALTEQIEFSKQPQKAKLPCGHLDRYEYTEDGGAHIACLLCELGVPAPQEEGKPNE